MDQLFASGRVIDLVLAILVVEALVLWRLRRPGFLPLPTLLAGLGLLVAWRVMHAGAGWIWVAPPLAAAGLAHGWDLWRRWNRP